MISLRFNNPIHISLTVVLMGLSASVVALPPWSEFGPATADLDTANSVAGGCPIESRDGHSLYMASNRPGGEGDLDIWVAHRPDKDAAFGLAENLGPPVNSEYADFCPTPIGGKYLFFVSTRPAGPNEIVCGGGDMYLTRLNPARGWEAPLNLGCAETGEGPNTAGSEFSPSLVEAEGKTFLFFSSTGYTDTHDLMVSQLRPDGSFAPATPVGELNTEHDDRMPNVSKDGLEIVFSSSRPTWGDGQAAFGGFDVYYAKRNSTDEPFSEPINLGPGINTAGSETRSSFSWDRERVHFGRAGEIYVTKREKIRGKK
jgi:hypothetical protein